MPLTKCMQCAARLLTKSHLQTERERGRCGCGHDCTGSWCDSGGGGGGRPLCIPGSSWTGLCSWRGQPHGRCYQRSAPWRPECPLAHSCLCPWSHQSGRAAHTSGAPHWTCICQGRAGQGRAGQGRAGQGRAGQGRAGQGRAGQGRAGQGRAGQGRAGQGRAGRGGAGRGGAGRGGAGRGRAGRGGAGRGRTGQGWGRAGQDRAGRGRAGQGRAGLGQGRAG